MKTWVWIFLNQHCGVSVAASRAVVFDAHGKVALLDVGKKEHHKLPGGGIEAGEDVYAALRRELLEEIGCNITNIRELGAIEEYRGMFSEHQTSYCFIADVDGEKGRAQFTRDELDDGFAIVWQSLEDAIAILEAEAAVEDYYGKFIRLRDLVFLQEIQKNFQK